VRDDEHDLWALGPPAGGTALATADAADPGLMDRDGNPFRPSAVHGRKVLLGALARWGGGPDSLPGGRRLHADLHDRGLTVATVALDIDPDDAHPFIDAAQPTHPSLIDTCHVTDGLFGFVNVPMAVWIDEQGTIVRPAEHASVERSPLRDMD